jgi:hypothetical protein
LNHVPGKPLRPFKGGHYIEIQMRELQIAEVFGEKTKFTPGPDLAMAHRLVPRVESVPERIGRAG